MSSAQFIHLWSERWTSPPEKVWPGFIWSSLSSWWATAEIYSPYVDGVSDQHTLDNVILIYLEYSYKWTRAGSGFATILLECIFDSWTLVHIFKNLFIRWKLVHINKPFEGCYQTLAGGATVGHLVLRTWEDRRCRLHRQLLYLRDESICHSLHNSGERAHRFH